MIIKKFKQRWKNAYKFRGDFTEKTYFEVLQEIHKEELIQTLTSILMCFKMNTEEEIKSKIKEHLDKIEKEW